VTGLKLERLGTSVSSRYDAFDEDRRCRGFLFGRNSKQSLNAASLADRPDRGVTHRSVDAGVS
jgi:hypothetical protein